MLDNGETIDADLVLIGIGVQPATSFLKSVDLARDGGIEANQFLSVHGNLYVAGDIAHHPYGDATARIEHWRVAAQQGRIAGMNMAGANKPYRAIPFFWTAQQGHRFRYVGHVDAYDEITYDGDPGGEQFIAFYIKDSEAKAALDMGRDRDMVVV